MQETMDLTPDSGQASPAQSAVGEAHEELIDIEEYAKTGRRPPCGCRYRIRIDKTKYEVAVQSMTGRELLVLAGKNPPERFMIVQRLDCGQTKRIELNQSADFTTLGVERFMTLPLDQTEG